MSVIVHKGKEPTFDRKLRSSWEDSLKARKEMEKLTFKYEGSRMSSIGPIYNTETKEWEKGISIWITVVDDNAESINIPDNFPYQINLFQDASHNFTIRLL